MGSSILGQLGTYFTPFFPMQVDQNHFSDFLSPCVWPHYFYPFPCPIGKVGMYEGMEVGMSSWVIFGLMIIGCIILIAVISRIEAKYNKRLVSRRQEIILENASERAQEVFAEDKQPEFVVGQVYQMEDGTLAKYATDGKFYKIKME